MIRFTGIQKRGVVAEPMRLSWSYAVRLLLLLLFSLLDCVRIAKGSQPVSPTTRVGWATTFVDSLFNFSQNSRSRLINRRIGTLAFEQANQSLGRWISEWVGFWDSGCILVIVVGE